MRYLALGLALLSGGCDVPDETEQKEKSEKVCPVGDPPLDDILKDRRGELRWLSADRLDALDVWAGCKLGVNLEKEHTAYSISVTNAEGEEIDVDTAALFIQTSPDGGYKMNISRHLLEGYPINIKMTFKDTGKYPFEIRFWNAYGSPTHDLNFSFRATLEKQVIEFTLFGEHNINLQWDEETMSAFKADNFERITSTDSVLNGVKK